MAGQYLYSFQTGSVAVAGSTTKTLWQLNPVTNPVTLVEWGISFDASTATTAVRVDLLTQSTAGTASSATPVRWADQAAPAATTTVLQTYTVEPTAGFILASYFIQPAGGLLVIQYPMQRETGTAAAATTNRIGLRYVSPGSVTPNAIAYVVWSEG